MESDTPCADPPLLKVSGPGELAHAIPYLLGFHPHRSLVLVGLRDRRVVVTARADLDHFEDDVTLLARTAEAMLRSRVRSFVGVVFDDTVPVRDPQGELAWAGLADETYRVIGGLGSRVDELALVSRGRMWSYDCDDSRCCPPQGRPIEGTSPVAAAAAYAGLVALPDRETLAETLACAVDEAELPGLLEQLARAEQGYATARPAAAEADERAVVRTLFAAAREADEPGASPRLDTPDLARFAVALRRFEVRDAVWIGIDDKRIDGRALWRHLGTHLPAPHCAAPLFLFAWASWRAGNGALAGIAADLAVEADPDYTAADLVRGALDSALDPALVPPVGGAFRATRAERRAARQAAAGRRHR